MNNSDVIALVASYLNLKQLNTTFALVNRQFCDVSRRPRVVERVLQNSVCCEKQFAAVAEFLQDEKYSFCGELAAVTYMCCSFECMKIPELVLRGLFAYGFENPSDIQKRSIRPLCQGRDFVVQAQSGTGKTAVYACSMLSQIDHSLEHPQVIVLCPQRELAVPVAHMMKQLGDFCPGLRVASVVGGAPLRDNIAALGQNPHVVLGTPGRLLDLLRRRVLPLARVRHVVLDEADRMLEMFGEQIHEVLAEVPRPAQIGLLTSVMTEQVECLVASHCVDPLWILQKPDPPPQFGDHFYVAVEEEALKLELLCQLLTRSRLASQPFVLFCNTRRKAQWLRDQLQQRNYTIPADGIVTDLGFRGMELPPNSMVINYDIPKNLENYRDRCARARAKPRAIINFVVTTDIPSLLEIEAMYETQIAQLSEADLDRFEL